MGTHLGRVMIVVVLSLLLLNDLAIGNRQCDDKLSRNGCQSEAHLDGMLRIRIENERQNFMQAGMCSSFSTEDNSTFEPIGLCWNTNSDEIMNFDDFKRSNCFCDSKCHDYHDCCIDKVEASDINNPLNEHSCYNLKNHLLPYSIYVTQQCPSRWRSENVRSLCEDEALTLQKSGKYFTHLQNIPVHSMTTKLMYRNVYCAVCNGDTQLTKWKTHIHCNGHADHLNWQQSSPEMDFSTNATYNPENNKWSVYTGNQRRTCRIVVEEFLKGKEFLMKYDARLCKQVVDDCPPQTDPGTWQNCQSYTSYVYEKKFTGKFKVAYKNFQCAMCNQVPRERITCSDPSDRVLFTEHIPHGKTSLSLLFDFNFNDANDNQVGMSSNCLLNNGQIWDPILRACLDVACGRLYKLVNGKCVPLPNSNQTSISGIESDCRKVVLSGDLFVLTENNSIYVNYSKKIYSNSQFEVYKKENGVITQILVCADEELHFEFPPGQVWLSELTLGLSITCLLLHLITYSLLPKLRNRPGKVLMSLSSSLIIGHLFFMLGSYCRKVYWLCYLHAVVTHFGYLSAFFWMSVMAFDIHRTFSSSRTRPSSSNRTFIKYSLYAWISTLLVVTIAITTDQTALRSAFRPKYGDGVCWFNHKRGLLLFFALPLAALLLANLIFFIITAFNIYKVSKQTKLVNTFSEKMRYFLYIKLAVVLGLTWLFGFLAASLKIDILWYPFIILNGLQGVLIFIVFTVKKKVMHMLVVKLKLRSHKYNMSKERSSKNVLYSSLSNLTTLQTSINSSVVPALSGSSEMLKAIRRINPDANTKM